MITMNDKYKLSIDLDKGPKTYHPGDIISGDAILDLLKDSVIGRVVVRFQGQAVCKIAQSNGQSTSTFEARSDLFVHEVILHDDHYTHKQGSFTWPFNFEVPDHINQVQTNQKWSPCTGFLSSSDPTTPGIPPYFVAKGYRSGKNWNAAVLYSIEVILIEPEKPELSDSKTCRAQQKLRIFPSPTREAIDMNDPRQRQGRSEIFTIKSFRLLPEHIGQVSIMQRAKTVINSTSIPKFTFELDVSYSSILQTHHPQRMPFIIAATPKTDPNLTTVQPSQRTFYRYPVLKVKRFQLLLQATTMCRCPAVLSEHVVASTEDIILADQQFDDVLLNMRSLAWDQKNEQEEESPASVDFGKLCDIVVTSLGVAAVNNARTRSKKSAECSIVPSFTTHNVSRYYHLCWAIHLECAGEKLIWKGQSPDSIKVIGPHLSESQSADSYSDLPAETVSGNGDPFSPMMSADLGDGVDGYGSRRPSNRDTLPPYSASDASRPVAMSAIREKAP